MTKWLVTIAWRHVGQKEWNYETGINESSPEEWWQARLEHEEKLKANGEIPDRVAIVFAMQLEKEAGDE